jgi:hypothetical protein
VISTRCVETSSKIGTLCFESGKLCFGRRKPQQAVARCGTLRKLGRGKLGGGKLRCGGGLLQRGAHGDVRVGGHPSGNDEYVEYELPAHTDNRPLSISYFPGVVPVGPS